MNNITSTLILEFALGKSLAFTIIMQQSNEGSNGCDRNYQRYYRNG
ncbi:hypothetical protein [Aerosakkonema funiforme]